MSSLKAADSDAAESRPGAISVEHELVGRREVLPRVREIVADLARAAGPAIRIHLVAGAAGLGKTRLLGEFLTGARDTGCESICVRVHEYDQPVAYAVVRDLAAHAPEGPTSAQRATLAELTAAIASPLETDPHAVAALLAGWLESYASERPLLLAVDDIDLADDSSLIALSVACRQLRRGPVTLVLSCRAGAWEPGSTFAATIGRAVDDERGRVLALRPMCREDTDALVRALVDAEPDPALTERVFQVSRGVPLLVREALTALCEADDVRVDQGQAVLVDELAEIVLDRPGALLHRVFRIDDEALAAATAISVFGRIPVRAVSALADVVPLDMALLPAAVDRLVASTILVADRPGWLAFSQPLVREALYQSLGPVERRHILTALSPHISEATDDDANLLVWARTMVEAAEPGDQDAVDAALRAADALRHSSPAAAGHWYQLALSLTHADSADRGPILARQATSYWKGSRPRLSVQAGLDAVRLLPSGPLRQTTLASTAGAAYAMDDLEAAGTILDLAGDDLTMGLVAQRAAVLAQSGEPAAAEKASARAWRNLEARALQDRVLAYIYLGTEAYVRGRGEQFTTATARLSRLGHLADRDLSAPVRVSALESGAGLLLFDGRLAEAQPLLAQAGRITQQIGWSDIGGEGAFARVKAMYWAGEWDRALAAVAAEAPRLEFAELSSNLVKLRQIEAEILLERDELTRASAVIDELRRAVRTRLFETEVAVLQARLKIAQADPDKAERLLSGAYRLAAENGWRQIEARALRQLVACQLAQGRDEEAKTYADELDVVAESTQMRGTRWDAILTRARCHGELTDLQALYATARDEGLVSVAAEALLLAVRADDEADPASLQECLDLFHSLGARRRAKQVLELARVRELSLTRSRREAVTDQELTESERQLVRLVREGLSNREIAEALNYSRKTVEAYLSRIYRKTGTHSRMGMVRVLGTEAVSREARA
ncbi:MAG: AAA family ATPase [Nocardioidaceae bacterium]